ncbi:MAG TPA: PfkB family carbohydrate kinase [Solirubrobacteraceae bacterium]|nr:PfkB family carbohydrate kinase [Solirubrobacteraceae bacterium]
MRPVLVVGDVMVDVVARMSGPLAAGSDTPASIVTRPGGAGANVAAWLAEAGVDVTLAARVGADVAAARAAKGLRHHGVRLQLTEDPERPTGTCVVLVAPDGERSMLPDPGANAALAPGDLPSRCFRRGAHLHVAGYTLLRAGSVDAGRVALARARAAGMTVSIDPSSAALLAQHGADRFLRLVGHPDLLLPNADEARALTGKGDPRAAARALSLHAREVVVTRGAEGALWSDGRVTLEAPAVVAGAVADTTGAGDAFTAGFLAAWLDGAPAGAALERGHELAVRALA